MCGQENMPNSAGGFRQENETKIDATVVTLMGNGKIYIYLD